MSISGITPGKLTESDLQRLKPERAGNSIDLSKVVAGCKAGSDMKHIFGPIVGSFVTLAAVAFPIRAVENGCNEIRIFNDGVSVWEFGPGTTKLTCIDAGTGRRWQAQHANGRIIC
jgi:hypothetical protein